MIHSTVHSVMEGDSVYSTPTLGIVRHRFTLVHFMAMEVMAMEDSTVDIMPAITMGLPMTITSLLSQTIAMVHTMEHVGAVQ